MEDSNRRLARNTILLYVRMFFLMLIGLYTSRVILNTLGIVDYGINNVVGGVVVMFSILTNTISGAIGRFITFELGTGNFEKLRNVFSTSVYVQCFMALAIVIICEALGFWFLTNKMDIPTHRMDAAIWVFHCSIIYFGLSLIFTPYNALIVAHERMDAFAYISILEALAKLFIVFVLQWFDYDKLKLYSVLLLVVSIAISLIYVIYSRYHFKESKLTLHFNKDIFKHMASFAGWNMLGSGAWMLETQGTNILMNLFFGVTVNAARGIAVQINHIVQQFVNNFMTALRPQITKSCAAGNYDEMNRLMMKGAKFSYLLMFVISLPIVLETDKILTIWLKIYPEYAVSFVRFTIAISLCMVIINPVITAIMATGDIKKYQIIVGFVGLLQFPLIYIAFNLGFSPISAYVVSLLFYVFFVFFKPYIVRNLLKLDLHDFLYEVIIPISKVTVFSIIIPITIYLLISPSWLRFCMVLSSSLLMTIFVSWKIGMKESERIWATSLVKEQIGRLN